MNVVLTLNGTDITGYTVTYNREHQVCTGIGMLDVGLSKNIPYTLDPWDELYLYEEGSLVGKYYVSTVALESPAYLVVVNAQDSSKRLVDYFISKAYDTEDEAYNTRYWIEKFLEEAGVSYEFQSGLETVIMSNNTALGMVTAYEQVTQLLQMSGWYMYFTADGVCYIGKITSNLSSPSAYFDETDILSIATSKSDKILRNRAVVWGAADPTGKEWVFADVKRRVRWEYSADDSRAAVVSSSNIPTVRAAYSLAYKMLDEWCNLLFTKDAYITGARGVSLADVVALDTAIFCGSGIVTTVGSEMSEQGLKTHVILDEKCPRLFGMWNPGAYVYAGTWGGGVKRKPIKGSVWSNYNTGLTDLFVKDLFVNNGILSCVTQNGLAFVSKEWLEYWSPISLEGVTLSGGSFPGTPKARAVTQDKDTNNIKVFLDTSEDLNYLDDYARVTFSGGDCGVFEVTPNRKVVGNYPLILPTEEITIEGTATSPGMTLAACTTSGRAIVGIDIDNDYMNDYVSIMVSGVGRETDNYGCEETPGMWSSGRDLRAVVHFDPRGEYEFSTTPLPKTDYYSLYNDDEKLEALVFGIYVHTEGLPGNYFIYDAVEQIKIKTIDAPGTGATILCVRRQQIDSGDPERDIYYIYHAPDSLTDRVVIDKWNLGDDSITRTTLNAPGVPPELLPSYGGATGEWPGLSSLNYEWHQTSIKGRPHYLRIFYMQSKYAGAVYTIDDYLQFSLVQVVWNVDKETQGCYMTGDLPHDWVPTYIEARDAAIGGARQARIVSRGDSYAVYATFVERYWDEYYRRQIWPGLWDIWYQVHTILHFVYPQDHATEDLFAEGRGFSAGYSSTEAHSLSRWGNYGQAEFEWWLVDGTSGTTSWYTNGYDLQEGHPPFWEAAPVSYVYHQMRNSDIAIIKILHDVGGTDITWHWLDPILLDLRVELDNPMDDDEKEYTIISPFPNADSDNNQAYLIASGYENETFSLIAIPEGENSVVWDLGGIFGTDAGSFDDLANCGRIFCYHCQSDENSLDCIQYATGGILIAGEWGSLVLRRDEGEYTIINPGERPQRVDSSGPMPVVTVEDIAYSLDIIDNTALSGMGSVVPQIGVTSTGFVGDIRYTTTASGITDSGTSTYGNTLFTTIAGELYTTNIDDLRYIRTLWDFEYEFDGYDRTLALIETSNYRSEEQYVFVCTSGESPRFYQRDSLPFREQSTNLGEYPVTIIRLDDRI